VYATAFLLLTEAARFRPGDRVLMHSASGGVGAAVAGAARALGGGTLVGTVGRPDKVELARRNGYDLVVERSGDYAGVVREEVGAIDIVLDAMGTSHLDADLGMLAPTGHLVLFGNAGGQVFDPLPPVGRLLGGNLSIGGFSISSLSLEAPNKVGAALARGLNLLAGGDAGIEITDVERLEDVPEYQELISKGRGLGKYVVTF
jgi:NADPH2:quinone reductase